MSNNLEISQDGFHLRSSTNEEVRSICLVAAQISADEPVPVKPFSPEKEPIIRVLNFKVDVNTVTFTPPLIFAQTWTENGLILNNKAHPDYIIEVESDDFVAAQMQLATVLNKLWMDGTLLKITKMLNIQCRQS